MMKLYSLILVAAVVGCAQTPDKRLTPGATLDVTKQDVCVAGYSSKVRNVPVSVKRQVFSEYGIPYVPRKYEVDHLISLELGGSNSIRNLWPEPYSGGWNAHVKDKLENRLHEMVCDGDMSLPEAQRAIATNWVETYQKVFRTAAPLYRARKARKY